MTQPPRTGQSQAPSGQPGAQRQSVKWREFANCLDTPPEVFFPERGGSVRPAQAVCRECAVRLPCLEYALANKIKHGVWGGTSERQRRTLRSTILRNLAEQAEQSEHLGHPEQIEQVVRSSPLNNTKEMQAS